MHNSNTFGKFKYNRLPIVLKCSPDYAQEVMENIFHDIDEAEVYIRHMGTSHETTSHYPSKTAG